MEPVSPKFFSLTDHEMAVVNNVQFMLTKQIVVAKVYELFGKLAVEYNVHIENALPQLPSSTAKISKGENYNVLPYVILDFPRLFGKEDVFAIRCFFWWGNFFSITLHLSGIYQEQYAAALSKNIEENLFDGWYISCAETQWQHHFEEDNYSFLQKRKEYLFAERPFIKLAKKIPLTQWDHSYQFFETNFKMLIEALTNQAPIR